MIDTVMGKTKKLERVSSDNFGVHGRERKSALKRDAI
jgi:hypothetical protein